MSSLPTPRRAGALLGPLVLCLVHCEGRSLLPGEDGIDYGDGDGDLGDGDGDTGDGDGDSGDGDGDSPILCTPVVDDLVVTDETPREQIACVEHVLGDLTVGPTTELVDLSALAALREVDGTATIVGNLLLYDLRGLDSLERVDWLHIRRNRNLSSLHGADALIEVDRITVSGNDGMTSLAGLPTGLSPSMLEIAENELLASLDGLPPFLATASGLPLIVEVDANPALIDLGGLSDCCSAHTLALTLDGNDALPDLGGLEGFARLDTLTLHDNIGLTSLDGLDGLIDLDTLDIGYDRCVSGNDATLVSLDGAPNLIGLDVLRIQWVASLTDLSGLDGIGTLATLQIRSNESLAWDAVLGLAEQTDPAVLDICGGVGGPACVVDPCPMF